MVWVLELCRRRWADFGAAEVAAEASLGRRRRPPRFTGPPRPALASAGSVARRSEPRYRGTRAEFSRSNTPQAWSRVLNKSSVPPRLATARPQHRAHRLPHLPLPIASRPPGLYRLREGSGRPPAEAAESTSQSRSQPTPEPTSSPAPPSPPTATPMQPSEPTGHLPKRPIRPYRDDRPTARSRPTNSNSKLPRDPHSPRRPLRRHSSQ